MTEPRTFVIGDLHGCHEELCRLLDALALTSADTVCCLGDYIDRGPSPRAVIERLTRLREEGPRCVFLKGNHEDMFLAFLGEPGHYGEAFLWNGGGTTLASYGLADETGEMVRARLPAQHHEFLRGLETHAALAPFYCVHAGVRPTRPLTEQDEEDLYWIREDFIGAAHPFPYTVLYGHTPERDVRLHLPFKIGLDTGLVYGNRLSCLELRSGDLYQIRRHDRRVERRSLAEELTRAGVRLA